MSDFKLPPSLNNLPIKEIIGKIVEEVMSSPVTIVSTPTGSGKSVGIPIALYHKQYQDTEGQPEKDRKIRIFVSVPTVVAARSLFEYQKKLSPEISVGYAAEGEKHYTDSSSIIYVTSGHLRKRMINYAATKKKESNDLCDVLMVDEVHIGSLDNTVVMSLWRYLFDNDHTVPNLVLSSATITGQSFDWGFYIPVITGNFIKFPVTEEFVERDYRPDDRKLYLDAVTKTIDATKKYPGNVLVFGPGAAEVELMVRAFGNMKRSDWEIIPAYSSLSKEELDAIYRPNVQGIKKIIVATNIAEASITISDIGVVVDTATARISTRSSNDGLKLVLQTISKSSSLQRKGRTGRTIPGHYICMMTRQSYLRLPEAIEDEILRVPIYEVVLEFLSSKLDPVKILMKVNPDSVEHAVDLLFKLKLLVKSGENDSVVTNAGKFAPHFPLSVRAATLLWRWIEKGYPIYPGIVGCCVLDVYGPGYFYIPRKGAEEEQADYDEKIDDLYENKINKYFGMDDLETYINLWSDLSWNFGGVDVKPEKVSKYCRENALNNRKIRELFVLVNTSVRTMESIRVAGRTAAKFTIGPFRTKGLVKRLYPLIEEVYSESVLQIKPNGEIRSLEEDGVNYRIDRQVFSEMKNLKETVKFERIIALSTFSSEATADKGGRFVERKSRGTSYINLGVIPWGERIKIAEQLAG